MSWKCKSSKLGPQCKEMMQCIFVHRVFRCNVSLMYIELDASMASLSNVLPPSMGRYKPVKWDL